MINEYNERINKSEAIFSHNDISALQTSAVYLNIRNFSVRWTGTTSLFLVRELMINEYNECINKYEAFFSHNDILQMYIPYK